MAAMPEATVTRPPASSSSMPSIVVPAGVVTWSHPDAPFFFIRDASGGVCVYRDHTTASVRPVGRLVDIRGVTRMGEFAPAVDASDIVRISNTILPAATAVTLDRTMTGEDEAELHTSVDSFVTTFLESENAALTTDTVIEGGGEAEVEQEQIIAQRSAKSAKK